MVSNTKSTSTTLGEYELAGKPTTISEVEEDAPSDVVDEFNAIERFATRVQLPNRDDWLFVGRSTDRNPTAYQLFHRPEAPDVSGYAGRLIHKREFNHKSEDAHKVAFEPAGDGPNGEVQVHPVGSLTVESHDRTERLDSVLDEIRTALTDSDWTGDGRADTGYGEWIAAVNTLADFIYELEDQPEQFPDRAVMESKIMHGIARYPLDAEQLLAQVSDCLRDALDGGLYEASPEAFRSILLRYSEQKLPSEESS